MTERILQQPHTVKQVSAKNVEENSTFIDQALLALHTLRLVEQLQKIDTWLAEHGEGCHE